MSCRFYSTYFVIPFVSYLRPTGRTSLFILYFYYKIPCTESRKSEHYHPSEPLRLCIRKLDQNFVFRLHDFVYCHISSPFVSSPSTLSHCIAPYRSSLFLTAPHHFSSCQVRFFWKSSLYIHSLFSHLSHRLLKKGLASPCSFHSFCRFIPLQVYQCHHGNAVLVWLIHV
jgi:hypothetical protein